MKRKLTNNLGLKILAVVASILLWFVVVNMDDPVISRTYSPINVEVVNGNAITSEGKVYEILNNSDTISVVVTAKRSVIDSLSRDNIKATADIMDMTFMDTVAIDVKSNKYADKIETITPKTKNLKVAIEDLAKKQFSIEVETIGTPEEGHCIGNVSSNINIASVSGPVSVVSKIVRVIATVDTSGLSKDISTSSSVQLLDANDVEIDSKLVTCSVEKIHVDVEMLQTKNVGLSFAVGGNPAIGYGATGEVDSTPSTITIAGEGTQFNSLEQLTIPQQALSVEGASSDVDTVVNISNYLPEGIIFADREFDGKVKVKAYVAALQIKDVAIPLAGITFTNIPEGYEAVLTDTADAMPYKVRGIGAAFDAFDGLTATGTIDVSKVLLQKADQAENTAETLAGLYHGQVELVLPTGVTPAETKTAAFILKLTGDELPASGHTTENATGEESNE
ncbi:MAG: hypothetical protein GX567_03080 [Clostridia bacterium]|nr:hypothetical protein [Clostridia bacterium]